MKNLIMLLTLFSIVGAVHGEQFHNRKTHLYKKYLISEKDNLQSIKLPFSMIEYVMDDNRDANYRFYAPSDVLTDLLISIGYEGEEYKCFLLSVNNEYLTIGITLKKWTQFCGNTRNNIRM